MTFANHQSQAHSPPLASCYDLTGCTDVDGGKGTVCSSATETGALYDCPGYRLPTEAEWEFACRAGTTTAFYDGRVTTSAVSDPRLLLFCYDEPNLDSIGWYCTNSGHSAHTVGGKSANPWCLYDMLGNMAEWTNNGYDGRPYGSSPETDPGATLGTFSSRVRRGGPYYGPPLEATCFHRFGASPAVPVEGEGFRLVRTLPRSP
jgi:formylglycine-generating enzyme required for sulfatase activity